MWKFKCFVDIVVCLCLISDARAAREARALDYTLSELSALVQQQASAIQTLMSRLSAAENTIHSLQHNHGGASSATVNQLQTQVDTQSRQIQALQDQLDHTVAFTAGFTRSMVSGLSDNDVLKFDNIITNAGSGYDHTTGTFTAPVSGYYVFYVNIMAPENSHTIECTLIREGHTLDRAHSGSNGENDSQGSLMTTVHLTRGQKVWVIKSYGHGTELEGETWTVFTGYLIKAD